MAKVRLNMVLSAELRAFLEALAEEEGVTKTEIFRRALSVLKAYKQQIKIGRKHIGFTSDPSKLEAELVGILTSF